MEYIFEDVLEIKNGKNQKAVENPDGKYPIWAKRLDGFLEFNRNVILTGPGKISAEEAKLHAETEYEKYRIVQDRIFQSDFDRFLELENRIEE